MMGRQALTALLCLAVVLLQPAGAAATTSPPVRTLFQRRTKWQDHTTLLSAVQVAQQATAAHLIPEASRLAPQRLVVGDGTGAVHLLLAGDGALLGSSGSSSSSTSGATGSAVTALASHRLVRNATVVIAGHESGALRLWLFRPPGAPDRPGGADAGADLDQEQPSIELQPLAELTPQQVLCIVPPGSGGSAGCDPITQLGTAGGRGGKGLVSVVSAGGGVAVIRIESRLGSVTVKITKRVHAGLPIVAARAQQALLTLLSPDGVAALPAGLLDAASAVAGVDPLAHAPDWSPCAGGLNGSALVAAAFQEPQGQGIYAATEDGRLVLLVLGGTGGKKGCQLRAAARLPSQLGLGQSPAHGGAPSQPQLSLQLLRGYLLLSTLRHLAVYNITDGLSRKPPRLVLVQDLASLPHDFLPATGPGSVSTSSAVATTPAAAASAPAAARESEHAAAQGGPGQRWSLQHPGQATGSSSSGNTGRELLAEAAAATAGLVSGAQECQASDGSAEGACGLAEQPAAARAVREAGQAPAAPRAQPPLLATDGDSLVAVGFGGGVLAVYESRMPQRYKRPPPPGAGFIQFLQPMAILGVAGVVLYRARNRRQGIPGAPGARGGGRDSLGEFERLLRGGSAGRRGAFGRFDAAGSDDDMDPLGPLPRGRVHGTSPGDQRQQQGPLRGPGGPRSAAAAARAGGGGEGEGRARLREARRARGLGAQGGASLPSYRAGAGPRGAPGAAAPLPGRAAGAMALAASDDEGEEEGSIPSQLFQQQSYDYAPLPDSPTAGLRGPAVPAQGLAASDGEDEDGFEFELTGLGMGPDLDLDLDLALDPSGQPLLRQRRGGAAGPGGAAALDSLRRQYEDLEDD